MTVTEEALELGPIAKNGLSVAPRVRTLADLVQHKKARRLAYYWVPFCLIFGTIGVRLVADPLAIAGAVVFGIAVYSLVEYLMHRYLYHYEPENKILRFLTADVAREHLRHHDDPGKYGGAINGAQLPIVSFAALLALLAWALPFLPTGFCLVAIVAGGANYVAQELIHYCAHHMPMQRGLIGVVQRHHMLHHYRDDDTNFGLFWTFWDSILGTKYKPDTKRAKAG